MWEGPRRPCGFAAAGSSCYKMWAGLNGFDPRTDFVLGGVRIGMDCMNLVTVISEYTWVPVTLSITALLSSFWLDLSKCMDTFNIYYANVWTHSIFIMHKHCCIFSYQATAVLFFNTGPICPSNYCTDFKWNYCSYCNYRGHESCTSECNATKLLIHATASTFS